MRIPYEDIFKNSEIYNPVSSETLLMAGKIAQINPDKTIIDLASGNGAPSLLWASLFGVQVDGYELCKTYVEYANAHAKILHLDKTVRYFCQDLQSFTPDKKYDIVAALGFDVNIYGGRTEALNRFKSMLNPDGIIILSEPNWITKPVPQQILTTLGITQEGYPTLPEMQQLLQQQGLKELWHAAATKETWEIFVRPTFITMQEYIKNNPALTQDAQKVIDGFKAEYEAAGKYWNVTLWVLKPN